MSIELINRFLYFFLFLVSASLAEDELVAVATICRHGERTPITYYPADPHKDSPLWTAGLGDLTIDGKKQMFEIGKWLRKRYSKFLSTSYKKNEIYILSSDEDRCITSAAVTLAGLFPPETNDIWNPDLLWQPIPVHTKPKESDDMFSTWQYSLRFQPFLLNFTTISEDEMDELCKYLSKHTGKNISNFFEALLIWDVLYVEELKNLTLPEWTKEVYPDKLSKLHKEFYLIQTSTLENTRVVVGRLLHDIIEQFDAFENNSNETSKIPKMKFYSCHDINIHFILRVLKIEHSLDIPFGALITIELRRKKTGKLYVQLVYKTTDVEILQLKPDSSECDYEEFKNVLSQYAVNAREHRAIISKLKSSL